MEADTVNLVRVTGMIDEETAAKVERYAAAHDVSRSWIVRQALRAWLEAKEVQP